MRPTLEVEDNGCFDCQGVEATYMLCDAVWSRAWPTYLADRDERQTKIREVVLDGLDPAFAIAADEENIAYKLETHGRLFLCLSCVEKRLGRALSLTDFVPWEQAPCNRLLLLGYRMGSRA